MPLSGADQFALLARALKRAGEGGLRANLNKRIAAATGPVIRAQRSGLPAHLPVRYAADVAADLQLRTAKNITTGISIRARSSPRRRRIVRLNTGYFYHPLFGDRNHWYFQRAKQPGWFSGPADASAPDMREAILAAMEDTARAIISRS